MPFAIGLKFEPDAFPNYYRLSELDLDLDDFCVVADEQGHDRVGFISDCEPRCPCQLDHLEPIRRQASDEEIESWHERQIRQRKALAHVRERVLQAGLPMKIISVEFDDEQNTVLFRFTSDRRVDFRDLVCELASHFRARIELWQIGSRQGACEKGGIGICGHCICCMRWMKDYPPVSMRHVREQDLANQTPQKLAGLCGRLRCCLRYEHCHYEQQSNRAPAVGGRVRDGDGREGVVIERNLLTGRAQVRFSPGRDEWFEFSRLEILDKDQPVRPPAERENGEDEVIDESE